MKARRLAGTLIAALFALGAPSGALAEEPAPESDPASETASEISQPNYPWTVIPETLVELALLRPLGAAATAAGLPMFIASAPLMWPSGEFAWSWDVFVMAPFDYTFTRPFRDF